MTRRDNKQNDRKHILRSYSVLYHTVANKYETDLQRDFRSRDHLEIGMLIIKKTLLLRMLCIHGEDHNMMLEWALSTLRHHSLKICTNIYLSVSPSSLDEDKACSSTRRA